MTCSIAHFNNKKDPVQCKLGAPQERCLKPRALRTWRAGGQEPERPWQLETSCSQALRVVSSVEGKVRNGRPCSDSEGHEPRTVVTLEAVELARGSWLCRSRSPEVIHWIRKCFSYCLESAHNLGCF